MTYYGHYLFNQVLLIVIDPADKFTPFKKIADSDINLIFSYDMGDRMFLLNYGSCFVSDKTLIRVCDIIKVHEMNPMLLRVNGQVYILCGNKVRNQPIELLSRRLRIAIVYRDTNFLVSSMPSNRARQQFIKLDQQKRDFLALANMPWEWSYSRLCEVTSDETIRYTSAFG